MALRCRKLALLNIPTDSAGSPLYTLWGRKYILPYPLWGRKRLRPSDSVQEYIYDALQTSD